MPAAPSQPIYLDYQATTPVDPRVAATVLHAMTDAFGNANSSEHVFGVQAEQMVSRARSEVARLVGAEDQDVRFTSGATESVRLAVEHLAANTSRTSLRIVVSRVEHRAVLEAVDSRARRRRAQIRWAKVDHRGRLDISSLGEQLAEPTDLVCVMAANNEIGTLYPIREVARLAARANARLLVDATQVAGKEPIETREWGIDYLALSAHKLYGPKGCGALIVPREVSRGFETSGTPNVPGIVGLGEACRLRRLEMQDDERRIARQRDRLQELLLGAIPGLVVNGDLAARLAGNLHVAIPDTPADAVLARICDRVAISTGAACSSGSERPSHVLEAIGLPPDLIEGALRIGLGKFTTDQEVETAAKLISAAATGVRVAIAS